MMGHSAEKDALARGAQAVMDAVSEAFRNPIAYGNGDRAHLMYEAARQAADRMGAHL